MRFIKYCLSLAICLFICMLLPQKVLAAGEYTYEASNNLNFEDISSTGNRILQCDDCIKTIDLGFDFTFYGLTYRYISISSNGVIFPGVVNDSACCSGRALFEENNAPTVDEISGFIAPWWEDLWPSHQSQDENGNTITAGAGDIYYQIKEVSGFKVVLIQYQAVAHYPDRAIFDEQFPEALPSTFQVKLFEEDMHIEFHYQQLSADRGVHSIGLESPLTTTLDGVKVFRASNAVPTDFNQLSFHPVKAILKSSFRFIKAASETSHRIEFKVNNPPVSSVVPLPADIIVGEGSSKNVNLISVGSPQLLIDNETVAIDIVVASVDAFTSSAGTVDLISVEVDLNAFGLESSIDFQLRTQLVNHSVFTPGAFTSKVIINDAANRYAMLSTYDILSENIVDTGTSNLFYRDTTAKFSIQATSLAAGESCGGPEISASGDEVFVFCQAKLNADDDGYVTNATELYLMESAKWQNGENAMSRLTSSSQGDVDVLLVKASADGVKVAFSSNGDLTANNPNLYPQVFLLDRSNNNAITQISSNASTDIITDLSISDDGLSLVYLLSGDIYRYQQGQAVSKVVDSAADAIIDLHLAGNGLTLLFSSSADESINSAVISTQQIFKQNILSPDIKKLTNGSENSHSVASDSEAQLIYFVSRYDFHNASGLTSDAIYQLNADDVFSLLSIHLATEEIKSLRVGRDGLLPLFDVFDSATSLRESYQILGIWPTTFYEVIESNEKGIPDYRLPGSGKSGSVFYFIVMLLVVFSVRKKQGSKSI